MDDVDGALEPHPAELRGGPGQEQARLERPRAHHVVDHAGAQMDLGRADLLGRQFHAERRLDEGRARHAEDGLGRRDEHVAQAGEVGVAGEGATRDDAHGGRQTREPGEGDEGLGAAAQAHVQVMRPRAAALEPADRRQPVADGEIEHVVDLQVIDRALRAGMDGVVVGDRHHGEPVDRAGAHDETICRALHALARRAGQEPVLDEASVIEQVGDVLARGQASLGLVARDGGRARLVERRAPRLAHGLELRGLAVPGHGFTGHGPRRPPAPRSRRARARRPLAARARRAPPSRRRRTMRSPGAPSSWLPSSGAPGLG